MAHGLHLRHRHDHGTVGQADDEVRTLGGFRSGRRDDVEVFPDERERGPGVPVAGDMHRRGWASRPWMAFVAVAVVAAIGSLVTRSQVDGWYADLDRPSYTPPDAVFGPVWTALYVLLAISGFLLIADRNRVAAGAWWLQLGLQLAWTVVFFGVHQPTWALGVIVALLVALVVCTMSARRTSTLAAALLVPSLVWVAFAAVLNAGIMSLN
jgi:translocator protein